VMPERGGCWALLAVALLAGSACTVGPGYKRPTAQVPDAWKGEGPWQTAAPKDAIPKGAWWQIFHDAELDRLEQNLLQANQSLDAARDRLSQARSQARVVSSAYFPTVSVNPSAQREEVSSTRAFSGGELPPFTQSDFVVPFSVSYELDLFGRVRRSLEAGVVHEKLGEQLGLFLARTLFRGSDLSMQTAENKTQHSMPDVR